MKRGDVWRATAPKIDNKTSFIRGSRVTRGWGYSLFSKINYIISEKTEDTTNSIFKTEQSTEQHSNVKSEQTDYKTLIFSKYQTFFGNNLRFRQKLVTLDKRLV